MRAKTGILPKIKKREKYIMSEFSIFSLYWANLKIQGHPEEYVYLCSMEHFKHIIDSICVEDILVRSLDYRRVSPLYSALIGEDFIPS